MRSIVLLSMWMMPAALIAADVCQAPAAGPAGASAGQSEPLRARLDTPIRVGEKLIRATAHHSGPYTLCVQPPPKEDGEARPAPVAIMTATAGTDGALTFDLSKSGRTNSQKGIEKGALVSVVGGPNNSDRTEAFEVEEASKVTVIIVAPAEGQRVVTGEIAGGDADQVRVEVISNDAVVDVDTAAVDSQTRKFSSALNRILATGQTVRVIAMLKNLEVGTSDYTLVRSALFDWGRARAYFTVGSTVAKTNEEDAATTQFSSAEWFVSLNVDKNWFTTLHQKAAARCPRPARFREELTRLIEVLGKHGQHFDSNNRAIGYLVLDFTIKGVNELRTSLGSLPCNGATLTIDEATAEAELLRIEGALIGHMEELDRLYGYTAENREKKLALSPTPAAIKDADDRWKNVEGELGYVRIVLKELAKSDADHVRGGWLFNTSVEGRLSQAPLATTAPDPEAPANPVAAAGTAEPGRLLQNPQSGSVEFVAYAPFITEWSSWRFNNNDYSLFVAPLFKGGLLALSGDHEEPHLDAAKHVYGYHSYGVRIGHLQLDPRPKNVAPELLSFLDIAAGRFDNFRRLRTPGADGVGYEKPLRVEFHGRFKIPATPVYLGFNSNMGAGPDDMRFFFGTRFDIGKLIARAIPQID